MTERECLDLMVAPGTRRPTKPYREGVIQIHITRACNLSCYACTQGSNLRGKTTFMTPEQFEQAVLSLQGYFGVYGVFGGNPALSPYFEDYCGILQKLVPFNQRGIWCNNPMTVEKARLMRDTFDPSVSNLNVHLDRDAYRLFKGGWPEANCDFGLRNDSRHSPPYVAMKDVLRIHCPTCYNKEQDRSPGCNVCGGTGLVYDEGRIWELISNCDINRGWSALIGVFRGELRAWFCEVAGAQAILHQDEPDYPDTGLDPNVEYEVETRPGERLERTVCKWWQLPMAHFRDQVRRHCFSCGVPLRGYGELSQAPDEPQHVEQVSSTHQAVYKPKRKGRKVELVTVESQLGGRVGRVIDYIANGRRP